MAFSKHMHSIDVEKGYIDTASCSVKKSEDHEDFDIKYKGTYSNIAIFFIDKYRKSSIKLPTLLRLPSLKKPLPFELKF